MEIPCKGTAPEIYAKLKSKLDAFKKSGKLEQVEQIEFKDPSFSVLAKGTGFKSDIQCRDGKVVVELDLNFLLKPMRGKIEEVLKKRLSEALA